MSEAENYDILCILGTDHHPFTRLLGWVDAWQRDAGGSSRVLVQHGFTESMHATALDQIDFVGHDELAEILGSVRAVVCHGGPGTIFDCRRAGLVPVVVPRAAAHGEHVDDHQVLFTKRLAAAQLIDRVQTEEEFRTALTEALHRNRTTLELADDVAVASATGRLASLVDAALAKKRGRRSGRTGSFTPAQDRVTRGEEPTR